MLLHHPLPRATPLGPGQAGSMSGVSMGSGQPGLGGRVRAHKQTTIHLFMHFYCTLLAFDIARLDYSDYGNKDRHARLGLGSSLSP
jgi:hypothetical protein